MVRMPGFYGKSAGNQIESTISAGKPGIAIPGPLRLLAGPAPEASVIIDVMRPGIPTRLTGRSHNPGSRIPGWYPGADIRYCDAITRGFWAVAAEGALRGTGGSHS